MGTLVPTPNGATARDLKAILGDPEKLTDKLLAAINQDSAVLREAARQPSPHDEFRDRQAYGAELRAALN